MHDVLVVWQSGVAGKNSSLFGIWIHFPTSQVYTLSKRENKYAGEEKKAQNDNHITSLRTVTIYTVEIKSFLRLYSLERNL